MRSTLRRLFPTGSNHLATPIWAVVWLLLLLAPASSTLPASALAQSQPQLRLPVDCEMGRLCLVQNYVDLDPGPDARDYTCGPLTTDGHDGTDIRVPSVLEMRRKVPVVAAAAGVVTAAMDGMADVSISKTGPEAVRGRRSGNRVVIDHGNDWVTQYSHLMRGSVAVTPGQSVEAGERLGYIGLSGKTEFPHLHFSFRHQGISIDPFSGLPAGEGCGKRKASFWNEEAQRALTYRAGGLLFAGFAPEQPRVEDALDGLHRAKSLSADSPSLVFWVGAWGLRRGDRESLRLTSPEGSILVESSSEIPEDKAHWFRSLGKRRTEEAWPAGTYQAEYRVERPTDGGLEALIDIKREIVLR